MTMTARACEYCLRSYVPRRSNQRSCSVACRAELNRKPASRASDRGKVATMLVREWSPARRTRIRSSLLAELDPADPKVCERPEMQLVALIDKISGEDGER